MTQGCRQEFSMDSIGLQHPRPVLFVTSQWPMPGLAYICYRVVVFLFCWGWMLYGIAAGLSWHSLLYLTTWGFGLICLSSLWQAAIALWGYIILNYKQTDLNLLKTMPWFLKGAWVVYNIVTCGSMIITVVYWPLLFHGGESVDAADLILHGANSVYVVGDMFIVATPIRLLHVFHTMLLGVTYIIVNSIYTTQSGDVLYSILDWNSEPGESTMYALLIGLVATPLTWLLVYGIYRLRLLIYARCVHPAPISQSREDLDMNHMDSSSTF